MRKFSRLLVLAGKAKWLLVILLGLMLNEANATHFRYGTMTWRKDVTFVSSTQVRIVFNMKTAWRWSFPWGISGGPVVGSTLSVGSLVIAGTGFSGSAPINVTVTAINVAEDYLDADYTYIATLPISGYPFTASFTSNARISTLQNNRDLTFRVETIVPSAADIHSPVASLPAIVNMPVNSIAATYPVPAVDADGEPITLSLAAPSTFGGGIQPAGLSVSGINLVFDTRTSVYPTRTVGSLWNAVLNITDSRGGKIALDVIIRITAASTPPFFVYPPTPPNSTQINVRPLNNVSFSLRASDADVGDLVGILGAGFPTGVVYTPVLGNPGTANFSWTPTNAQIGTYVINFTAKDVAGVVSSTSVTIRVSVDPEFMAPTFGDGSTLCATPGDPVSTTFQARDLNLTNTVSLSAESGVVPGMVFSPALPTAFSNPVSTSLNWTPTAADWGVKTLVMKATNQVNFFRTTSVNWVVNTRPVITSIAPVGNIVAGQPFSYTIVATDADIPQGDFLEIETSVLPSFLSIVDNGDNTFTISGTPTLADLGVHSVLVELEDQMNHVNGTHCGNVAQGFDLNVIPCNLGLTLTPTPPTCAASNNGSIFSNATGVNGTAVYAWSNGASTANITGLGEGNYSLTISDDYGCTLTESTTLTAPPDVTKPVPDVTTLPIVTGECAASATAPTATDNCSGVITGTTTDATSFTAQGTYVINWSYDDGNGNVETQQQTVIVKDISRPVPDVTTLPTVTGECAASATAPTATDNCSGVITATTTDATSFTAQGTYVINWSYDDGNGNVETQQQTVIVKDISRPVTDVTTLPTVTGECAASATAPTATDNCSGVITGTTTDATSFTAQGTYVINWSYDDGNGNVETQQQTVIVKDISRPVPDVTNLPTVTGECAASATAPTATDNCSGVITATTTDATSFTAQGTYVINWSYDDGNGNVETQQQTVIVKDISRPVPDVTNLPTVTGECSASVTAPTATDNCSGTITGTTSDATSFTAQGTYVINWSYDDGNGNVETQLQTVIVKDISRPVPDVTTLPTVTGECAASATAPTATDNCSGVITATTTDATSFTAQGTYVITWSYDDGNGNVETQQQTVIVKDISRPVPDVTTLPIITGECAASATAPTANDNCSGVITGTTTDATSFTAQGTYVINWSYDDGNGNVETQQQTVIVKDVTNPDAICKAATVTLAGGTASITVADIDGGSSDNCGIQSISASRLSFDCSNIGDNNVTLTVTDIAGNISTCTAVVTVVGEIPTCSIASIPSGSTFTGGVSTNLYLGYGAQSTTLQVNAPASGAPYTYAWNGGTLSNYNTANPVFTATAAGTFTFTVEVTNRYGCKTTCSITICVTDIRVPGTNGNKVYVCHIPPGNTGNPQTLSISVNAVPAHVGLHGGDRLGTCDMQPCTAPSIVSKKSAVDADEAHGALKVTVAPNPTSTHFTFRLHSEDETPVSIRIVNGTGQVLESANKVNSNGTIQMGSKLVNGMYFAEFMQGTDRQVIKVMKIGSR